MNNSYSKKTILQVLPSMREGGVERGVYDICRYAKKSGFEWEIIVASQGGKFADKLTEEGIKHITIGLNTKNPIKIILNAFKLARICRENNVGIVHARSRAPAWSAFITAKMLKIKFITSFHGFYKINCPPKKLYNSVMARGERVIAVSEFIKEHIIRNYKCDIGKITVIHRGVDLEFFDPDKVKDQDISKIKEKHSLQGKKVILLVGRITRWKGQDLAIEAMNLLKEQNTVLLIVGSAEKGREDYYNELTELSKKNKTNEVVFAGSSDDLPVYYKCADVVLNCSREAETFGRVTAEAGAFGKPVIATNIGGSLEIIQENETGFLVAPNDPKQLAEKIDEVLQQFEDKDFAEKFSTKTKQRITEKFSLDQMCRKNFEIYREEIKY